MQHLTYVVFINLAHYYGKRPWQLCVWSTSDFACAVVSFPDQWLWYLVWERDYMCACIQNYKMASFATDSNYRVLWMAFVDQGEFEAMKNWVVVELHAVISISFVLKWRWVLKSLPDIIVEPNGLNKKERIRKMALLLPHTLRLAVVRVAFDHLYESC